MYKQNFDVDTTTALEIIGNLSNQELKDLLVDDAKFEDIVKNVGQVNKIKQFSLLLTQIFFPQ